MKLYLSAIGVCIVLLSVVNLLAGSPLAGVGIWQTFALTALAAVAAIAAGCDMVLMPEDLQEAFDGLKAAVEDGTLTEARIDESVRRILTVKAAYGLLKD